MVKSPVLARVTPQSILSYQKDNIPLRQEFHKYIAIISPTLPLREASALRFPKYDLRRKTGQDAVIFASSFLIRRL